MPEEHTPSVTEWDESWNVCVERMDRDHRVLFGYFQEFEKLAADTEVNKDALRDVIMKFLSRASTHFMYEEREMASSDMIWAEQKAHMDDHMLVQSLFLKVIGPVVRNSLDLPAYRKSFMDAFIAHITVFDIPLAELLRQEAQIPEK